MEATTVPTKKCSVCQKNIEEPKFRIHEATCARNNFKCPVCQEVVPKSEKEAHDLEVHVQVPCQYCNEFLAEKQFIKEHELYCDMKPRQCLYCEISVGGPKYEEHVRFCGSKTKKCEECGMSVCFKNVVMHMESNQCLMAKNKAVDGLKTDLEKFQMREKDEMKKRREDVDRKERKEKETQLINKQLGIQQPKSGDTRQYVKNPDHRIPIAKEKPQSKMNPVPSSTSHDPLGDEDEETQKMIARMMQEEMDGIEAQNFQHDSPGAQKHQFNYDNEGIRAPVDIYQETLLGGPANRNGNPKNKFYSGVHLGQQARVARQQPNWEVEDSEMRYDEPSISHSETEDQMFRRVMQESMKDYKDPSSHGGQEDEDSIMQQILEESKRNK